VNRRLKITSAALALATLAVGAAPSEAGGVLPVRVTEAHLISSPALTQTSTAASAVGIPVLICDFPLQTQYPNADHKQVQATAYVVCNQTSDLIQYTWTWTDDTTGQTILSQSEWLSNQTDFAAQASSDQGTIAHRTVKFCLDVIAPPNPPQYGCNPQHGL
jgi:hypothetical protein